MNSLPLQEPFIQKADKTWKKIIFYNIGLSPMLAGKEKLLDKMEDDFRIFKEYKDEVVLLWRPHPLLAASMEGMLPELQERYENIVERYKSEGWGIYDDTADLNRAMVISDAYFGDGSSVLLLYETTGKPIMHHLLDFFSTSTKLFKINQAYYEDNQIWCTMFYDPYLYKIDMETKEISIVTSILDDDPLDFNINIFPYKDSFIFLQSNTHVMIIMNRTTLHKSKYKIPFEIVYPLSFGLKFANVIVFNDNIYIFGLNYRGIVKFNLITEEFSVIDEFLNDLKITNHNDKLCIYDYVKIEDKLYLPIANANAVLEFSLNDEKFKIHYVGDENQRYIAGAWDGSNIWLAPRNGQIGDIVKWNLKDHTVKQYKKPLKKNELVSSFLFDSIFKIDNSIIIMSSRGTNINLEINLDTEEITKFDDICNTQWYLGRKYTCLNLQGSKITYIDEFNLITYDFKTKKTEKLELKLTDDVMKRIDETEEDKLKFIFKPLKNGNSRVYTEQLKLNLHHLIRFLLND